MRQHIHALQDAHLTAAWVAIGSFDGVHRGHQAIISNLVSQAHEAGSPAAVITFYPHPIAVLRKVQDPFYLTSPEERARLLFDLGVDTVITLPFSTEMAALTAEEFMQAVAKDLDLCTLWVGRDFALGRNRSGTVERLVEIGRELGYTVRIVEPVKDQNEVISSSLIRKALTAGDAALAARLLGRYYTISGEVVHGDGRGKGIGIPTANLQPWSEQLVPANGVYATWTWVKGNRLPSITNIGVRPTFENKPVVPRIEAHLIDYDGDLYGQQICVEFVERVRPEKRFGSIEELLQQVHTDIERAREVFSDAQ
jgi:riboflavin kinase/FMN adenylyltransferase